MHYPCSPCPCYMQTLLYFDKICQVLSVCTRLNSYIRKQSSKVLLKNLNSLPPLRVPGLYIFPFLLSGVAIDSTVSYQTQTLQCSSYHRLCSVLLTTDSPVSCLSQTLRCPAFYRLSGVQSITDYTVSCLLQTQQCPVYHRLYGVLPSTNSAVSCLSQTQWCPAFYRLCGVQSITDSAVSYSLPQSLNLLRPPHAP